jgi:ligand-binding sensor domain-containing protein/signal transduction histidine kinase
VLLVLCAATRTAAERLPIRLYTTADGLASPVVLSIIPDSRGFLWFATRSGLSRFDGWAFRTYTTDDGLAHPVVNHLLETRAGEYWVATNGGGVCRFNVEGRAEPRSEENDPSRRTLFTCKPGGTDFQSNRVNVLHEDRQGMIWAGTDHGLFRLQRTRDNWWLEAVTADEIPGAPDLRGHEIYEDSQGRIWIGSSAGLFRRDPDGRTRWYQVPGLDGLGVRGIAEHENVFWVGSSLGVIAFRPDAPGDARDAPTKILHATRSCIGADRVMTIPADNGDSCIIDAGAGLPDNRVRALLPVRTGRLWIGTAGGLAFIAERRLTSLASEAQVGSASLDALARDRDGHLWIGTTAGAMRMTIDGFVSYGPADGLGHPRVHSLLEDPNGRVFAVTGEWVINRFSGGRFDAFRAGIPPGHTFGYASRVGFLDRANRWWLLTNRGVYRFPAGQDLRRTLSRAPAAHYTTRDGLPSDSVRSVFEDSRGDIWFAARATAVRYLTRWISATGQLETLPHPKRRDVSPEVPRAFAEDHRGAIWIGFEDGGLARFHEGRLTSFSPSDQAPPEVIDLHVDRSGRLWIASASAGLSVLEDPSADRLVLRRYTTAQGLSTNSILCLAEDSYGRIYLGTARGIDRLDPSTGRVKRLSTADGLAADSVTAAFRDRSGALWFGTTDGVSRLLPVPDTPSVPPPVWIGEVRVGGTMHQLAELGAVDVGTLTLAHGQNHLQVGFFGVGFTTGGPLRYRYRLEGAETDWSGPTDRRVVHYASLAPGRYRFVVEAINADGVASRQPASVSVTVLPPVWQQWWFVTSVAAFLLALAYGFHRARLSRVIELERIRARIAADLHDDIGGSLSRIAIQSEVARREAVETSGKPAQRLAEIGDTARSIVESLGDVVWSVDPLQDDLASLERRLREYAADILGPRGMRWTFHGTGHRDRLSVDPEARRDLLLLLKEGITNIARHANAQVASLHLRLARGELHAELRDDGRGFDQSVLDALGGTRGRGLANMRQRATRLAARLEIDSQPGRGTRVSLFVPLRSGRRMNMRLRRLNP